MKKLFSIIVFCLLFFTLNINNLNAHPGRTGPSGCHMSYAAQGYHCHKAKTPDPFAIYYYVHYRGQSHGPYSSYNSCMAAARGANLTGAYYTTYK
jgi:hypothetical protein